MHDIRLKGAAMGVASFCVLGMLVGSFAGGGPNPQALAVLVALAYLGVVAYLYSNHATGLGGRDRMLCIIAASISVGVLSAAVAWALDATRHAPPVAIALSGVAGWCVVAIRNQQPAPESPESDASAGSGE